MWKQCHIHIKFNQWICIENQLSGFYFKITLTGNKITNHEIHGFSNSFQHIKNWKNPENILAKYIFAYNLRKRFWRNVFGRMTKATMVHHLTPKKAHTDGSFFFQNPYCWFILEHFWTSLAIPTTLSRDIGNLLFSSTMSMADHTQEKNDQIAASMDILLHTKHFYHK